MAEEKTAKVDALKAESTSPKGKSTNILLIVVIVLLLLLIACMGSVLGYMVIRNKVPEGELDETEQEEADATEDSDIVENETTIPESDGDSETPSVTTVCTNSGTDYNVGESYTTTDGCQSCTCNADTTWSCSLITSSGCCENAGTVYVDGDSYTYDACRERTCMSGTWGFVVDTSCCHYDGTYYPNGESYPSTDGCNTCTCNMGTTICTMMICP